MTTLLDTPPPHSDEAEVSVLGACLLDIEAARMCSTDLTPEDFYKTGHGEIFRAALAVLDANARPDLVTVQAQLQRTAKLDSVGGPAYLREIIDAVPSSANCEYYVSIMQEKAELRTTQLRAMRIAEAVSEGRPIDEVREMPDPLEHISRPHPVQTLAEVSRDLSIDYVDGKGMECIATGLSSLDRLMCGGLFVGDLTVLAARTSQGKSSLAAWMAMGAARRTEAALLVTREQAPKSYVQRLVAAEMGADFRDVRTGKDHGGIQRALAALAEQDVPFRISQARSVREIRNDLRGERLVVVDYLQMLHVPGGRDNYSVRIGLIVRDLKDLAVEEQVAVLLLSQINRQAEARRRSRDSDPQGWCCMPHLSELKESGTIEEHSDNVLLMYRPAFYGYDGAKYAGCESVMLQVAKQRNGPTGFLGTRTGNEYKSHIRMNVTHMSWSDEARGHPIGGDE